jgi:tetratricopeptide (TPR) repeat protein
MTDLLTELRRRKVVRVGIAYAAAAFVVLQLADIALPPLGAPDWVMAVIIVATALGLPIAVALAWAFDVTPAGIEITPSSEQSEPGSRDAVSRGAAGAGGGALRTAGRPLFGRRGALTIATVAVLSFTVAGAYSWHRFATDPSLDAQLVVVLPFRISGGADAAYLREGMVDLLSTTLSDDVGSRAADPRAVLSAWRSVVGDERADLTADSAALVARKLGAGRMLLGTVFATPAELRITAELHYVGTARQPLRMLVTGTPDNLHALIDGLAAQMLSLESGVTGSRLAALTSTSLPALRSYLVGQSLYRRSRFEEAAVAFDRAVDEDSTFALAALGLRLSLGWGSVEVRNGDRARRLVATYLDRLAGSDAVIARASVGSTYPLPRNVRQELADWERAIEAAPERPESWFMYADGMLHRGGLVQADHGPASYAGFERALAVDSSFAPAITHLLDAAIYAGDTASYRRYRALLENSDNRNVAQYQYPTRLLFERAAGESGPELPLEAWDDGDLFSAVFTFHFADLLDVGEVVRVLDESRRRALTASQRQAALTLRMETMWSLGRPAEAQRAAAELLRGSAGSVATMASMLAAAIHWDGDVAAAAAVAPRLAAVLAGADADVSLTPELRIRASCVLAQWQASRGEVHDAALRMLDRAATDSTIPGLQAAICGGAVRAIHALHTGRDVEDALARLEALCRDGPPAGRVLREANFIIARIYEATGDRVGALSAVRRRIVLPESTTYATTEFREEGRLAEAVGERDAAIKAYTRYLAIRADAEPALAGEVELARNALTRLTAEGK